MGESKLLCFLLALIVCVNGEDPYRFFTWKVTYGDIYPLGVKQQVLFAFSLSLLLINSFNCLCIFCFFAFSWLLRVLEDFEFLE